MKAEVEANLPKFVYNKHNGQCHT